MTSDSSKDQQEPDFETGIPESEWPPLPTPGAAQIHALATQLLETQWLSVEELKKEQHGQLANLIEFVSSRVRFYRRGFSGAGLNSVNAVLQNWAAINPMTRASAIQLGQKLRPLTPADGHGTGLSIRLLDAEGRGFDLHRSMVAEHFATAIFTRLIHWYGWDKSKTLGVLRPGVAPINPAPPGTPVGWGLPYQSGPGVTYSGPAENDQIKDWLEENNPSYLVGSDRHASDHDSIMDRLILSDTCQNSEPGYRRVLQSVGFGIVAAPCPEAGKLHVQSESIYCEVVDEDGKPTDGTGRLLVTSLNNFAAPLLRFDTEVQVKWGEPCTCGRGLQVLEAPE